jgi:hypothetical protein
MDDLDRARHYQQAEIDAALTHRRPVSGLQATGQCHWCEAPVTGEQRFCDKDCADDWERRQAKR